MRQSSRITQRLRRWARLADARSHDPGADSAQWQDYAARLDRAAELFDAGKHAQAVAIRDAVIAELLDSSPLDAGRRQ